MITIIDFQQNCRQIPRFCQSREANRSLFNEVIKHRIPSQCFATSQCIMYCLTKATSNFDSFNNRSSLIINAENKGHDKRCRFVSVISRFQFVQNAKSMNVSSELEIIALKNFV